MKKYYILQSDKNLTNVIEPKGITKSINPDYVKENKIQFINPEPEQFYIEPKSSSIYPDYIKKPLPFISDKLYRIFFGLNINSIFYKPVVFADVKKMKQDLYWLIIPRKINCLSDKTEFNVDGSVNKMVIDSSKVGCYKVFKVKGIAEDFIILDEDIVALLTGANAIGLSYVKIC
ncbi:hypothetical protein [Pseudobacteroides cellulosolvens]|uniref:Uncharacterized protein n=1 Tax=Pseudobacteroides cellulosolvens ATCC 35603 = DSM 2933 TaxID=398512 RepID=A0A0L6JL63_9FIRM|nr:hypothetical protein [Pseudobacteroides cellulosolvens]KNY26561.1 hypothetical protein Bccel_1826 [Pseudobacteroides cellulosolvens ATCC 35603 = DSM 2933]